MGVLSSEGNLAMQLITSLEVGHAINLVHHLATLESDEQEVLGGPGKDGIRLRELGQELGPVG